MIYTIIILTAFSLMLLGRNYKNKFSWYFLVMIIGLNIAFFSSTLYISKIGNYQYPDHALFSLDYKLFLYFIKIKVNYYSILRALNIGIALYLFILPVFIYELTKKRFLKNNSMTILIILGLSILPLLYVWFYDPDTTFMFYTSINNFSKNTESNLEQLISIMDTILYIGIIFQLFLPFYFMIRQFIETKIRIKKNQILSLSISLFILNMLYFFVFIIGPFKKIYFMSSNSHLLKFPDRFNVPIYYFNILPVIMLLAIIFILIILFKFKGLDTTNFLNQYFINRHIRKSNKDLRGVFHSFKNTMFTIKILADQAKTQTDPDKKLEIIDRILLVSNTSLNSLTRMMNSLKEIKNRPSKNLIGEAINIALDEIAIPNHINIIKINKAQGVYSYFDFYQMKEAFINLIKNSIEAIEAIKIEKGIIEFRIEAESEWIIIKISDNGCGINKKDRKKLFEPFYSTKRSQSSWGIGLSYVFRVVKAHLGFITVSSIEGEGTTFEIILPITEREEME